MQPTTKPGLSAQTPLAIFPPILGSFGLGLAWRRSGDVFGMPPVLGELILGAVSLLFLFAVLAYLAKFVRRPGTLMEDLRNLPGRAGASTAGMAGMLFALVLLPYSPCLARGALVAAVAAHGLVALLIVMVLAPMPLSGRRITPVWHLTFVGFIVAPLAAIPLGATLASEIIVVLTVPLAITIWAGHLYLVAKAGVPPPLRPTLAIHLAPISLFGMVAVQMGYLGVGAALAWLSVLVFLILLLRARYLGAAGFSPLWGAFTFPLAALTNLLLMLSAYVGMFRIMSGLLLIFASFLIPYITYRIIKMWAAGSLAAKTNAARI